MNIIKIQDQLRGVADNTLVGYVQNPTGQVPTYLALAELQRRKEMRTKYQANKPEEKTVAEDLVQEAQPQMAGVMGLPAGQPMQEAMQPPPEMPMEQMAQGGLAELDVNDMYSEDSYAKGGIVAFAGNQPEGSYINPSLTQLPEVPEDQLSYFEKVKRRYAKMKEKEAKDAAIQSEKELSGIKNIFGIKGGYEYKPTDSAYINQVQANNAAQTNPALDNTVKMSDLPAQTKTGTGFNMPTLNIPEALTIDKAMADRKKAMELAGVPTDFYASQAEKLKADREALKADRDQAKFLAIAKGGFKAASQRPQYGKGQSAFADIAEGLETGLEQYSKDIKDIKAEDRLLKQADQKLAEAQYLQQRGDAEGAMKKISEREALIQDYNKLQYSGAVQLKAAAMSAGKQSDYESYMSRAEKNPKFYNKVDGKAVFDFEKAHNAYWGSRSTSGGLDQDTLWKSYTSGLDTLPNETFEMYKARKLGSGAGTAKTPTKPISAFGG